MSCCNIQREGWALRKHSARAFHPATQACLCAKWLLQRRQGSRSRARWREHRARQSVTSSRLCRRLWQHVSPTALVWD